MAMKDKLGYFVGSDVTAAELAANAEHHRKRLAEMDRADAARRAQKQTSSPPTDEEIAHWRAWRASVGRPVVAGAVPPAGEIEACRSYWRLREQMCAPPGPIAMLDSSSKAPTPKAPTVSAPTYSPEQLAVSRALGIPVEHLAFEERAQAFDASRGAAPPAPPSPTPRGVSDGPSGLSHEELLVARAMGLSPAAFAEELTRLRAEGSPLAYR